MTITDLQTQGYAYLSDLEDVEMTASPTSGSSVTVTVNGTTVLSHIYYADTDGNIHLDLRHLVSSRTGVVVPSGTGYTLSPSSVLSVSITKGSTTYTFKAYGYDDGLRRKLSDADYLRIPADCQLFVTMPNLANALSTSPVSTDIYVHDRVRATKVATISVTTQTSDLVGLRYSAEDLPVDIGQPFRIRIAHQGLSSAQQTTYPDVMSPVYEVANGQFEQYVFLNRYGHLENIPMDGGLEYVPELNFENAAHSSGYIRIREDREDLYRQNSGWMTRNTAEALSRLLSSRYVLHLEDGQWVPVLIEDVEVSISDRDNLHQVYFNWRHKSIA